MMLRSRGERSGRFHRSPRRGPCVYLASAGATIRTSSSVSIGGRAFDLGVTAVLSAWAKDETINESDAIAAVRSFMIASFRACTEWWRLTRFPENFSRAGRYSPQRRSFGEERLARVVCAGSLAGFCELARKRWAAPVSSSLLVPKARALGCRDLRGNQQALLRVLRLALRLRGVALALTRFHCTRLCLSNVRRAMGSSSVSSTVLLVADLFQPINVLTVKLLLNGD